MTTDPKPMTDKKLAAIQAALQKAKHNAPPMLLEAVAEILRLRAREKVLHEAVRRVSIHPDLSSGEEAIQCDCCIQWWRVHAAERHGLVDGKPCPAAPLEDQR